MKLVKNLVFTVVLVSTFAVNTPAGDLETPGIVAPPPQVHSTCVSTPDEDTTQSKNGIVICKPVEEDSTTADIPDFLLYEAWKALLSVF